MGILVVDILESSKQLNTISEKQTCLAEGLQLIVVAFKHTVKFNILYHTKLP